MKTKTRRRLWLAHRMIGLFSAAIFLVVALTGYLLLFQRELNLIGAERLDGPATDIAGIDKAVETLARDWDGYTPTTLLAPIRKDLAWIVFGAPMENSGATRLASIDPASGEVMGEGRFADTTVAQLWIMHNELYMGRFGRYVVLVTGALLVPLSLIGFAISSQRWRTLRSNPFKAKNRLRAFHRWAGLIALPLLLLWALTGVLLMVSALNDPAHSITDAMPARPVPVKASLPAVLATLDTAGEVFAVTLPTHHDPAISVLTVDRAAMPWAKFTLYQFDANTGAQTARMAMAEAPLWPWTLEASRALHMGLFERPAVHAAYLVAGLLPILMVFTGPAIWFRARRSKGPAARQRQA